MKTDKKLPHKLGANRNEFAQKRRKHTKNFSQSRDIREDRCARQEKFGHQPRTIPKTKQIARKVAGLLTEHASPTRHRRVVKFRHPSAKKVTIAGTFNAWNPIATPLQKINEVEWMTELVLDAGTYQYRFVVDGQWVDDPKGRVFMENEFGGKNAVLKVGMG